MEIGAPVALASLAPGVAVLAGWDVAEVLVFSALLLFAELCGLLAAVGVRDSANLQVPPEA